MRGDRPSWTAQHVAAARALLNRRGLIDDPYAEGFLRPPWRAALAFRRYMPPMLGAGVANIARRTLFYDAIVEDAIGAGVRQVVIVGAGYDARAWRLATDDVRFFEIDHPNTQADKKRRTPPGGPRFLAADLASERIDGALGRSDYRSSEPAVFVCEGLMMYLRDGEVRSLLTNLASMAASGSHLGVDFITGRDARTGQLGRMLAAIGGEPIRFMLAPDDVAPLVEDCGWHVVEVSDARALHQRFFKDSAFAMPAALGAYVRASVAECP